MTDDPIIPPGFRMERGLMWPNYDVKCAAVIFKMSSDLPATFKFLKKKRTVIQAGGNCGVWPRALAPHFDAVYTFEPDPKNYFALRWNTKELANVHTFNAALGAQAGLVTLTIPDHELDNCGAIMIDPDGVESTRSVTNPLPMYRIDGFDLPAVDLIYLDIEGYELNALKGAERTIELCKPIITLEDKGLSTPYGSAEGDVVRWLQDRGYFVAERVHRDVILAPK